MEVVYAVVYHPKVVDEDIPKISAANRRRIKVAIEEKLYASPEVFGKPLRQSLRGYRKLRVGDYRIVFRIEGKKVIILIIKPRSIVYEEALKRI